MSEGIERRIPSAAEDLALVRHVLRGNRLELPRLAERLRSIPRTLRHLDARRGDPLGSQELLDLSQDVLVLVWKKLAEYEGQSVLEGWLYGICVLEYRNSLRRKQRLSHEAQSLVNESKARAAAAPDPDPWAFEEVHEGLRRIGREEAQVIRLKHLEGRTFEEIGRALRISPGTVKTRYYRGLEELRPLLEQRGGTG